MFPVRKGQRGARAYSKRGRKPGFQDVLAQTVRNGDVYTRPKSYARSNGQSPRDQQARFQGVQPKRAKTGTYILKTGHKARFLGHHRGRIHTFRGEKPGIRGVKAQMGHSPMGVQPAKTAHSKRGAQTDKKEDTPRSKWARTGTCTQSVQAQTG